MNTQKLQTALDYMDGYWHQLILDKPDDSAVYIPLPHVFVSPSSGQFHSEQFYWDTYFILLGLVESPAHLPIAQGMVDNLLYLYKTYGLIPMRNRTYNTGISQPPFLTQMIRLLYDKTGDKDWLDAAMTIAEDELNNYWMNSNHEDQTPDHLAFEGLSRYADHYLMDQTAEHESGWDMTSRFNNHAFETIPVDLNSLLYKYETDLAWWADAKGDTATAKSYTDRANTRALTISRYLYSQRDKFFFDYNYQEGKRSNFWSLAGLYPLWAGLATPEQAEAVHRHIHKFEHDGGLTTTQGVHLLKPFRQWDYPNGWAPLQWITIQGLRNYGFNDAADRLTRKWLTLNLDLFEQTGKFWEKYDVVNRAVGKAGRYPNQEGFGWTNGVFIALAKQLEN